MDSNETQLTFWKDEETPIQPIKMEEIDPLHIWQLAVVKFDNKRWIEGWRPWRKD